MKHLIRQQPFITFINIHSEAIRWADDEERLSAPRARVYSCDTHSDALDLEVKTSAGVVEPSKEMNELKEALRKEQAQLDIILQRLSTPVWHAPSNGPSNRFQCYSYDSEGHPICMRCGQSGHISGRCNIREGAQPAAPLVGDSLRGRAGHGGNSYSTGLRGN